MTRAAVSQETFIFFWLFFSFDPRRDREPPVSVPSNSQLEDGQIPQQEPQNEEVYEEVGQPMAEPQEIAPPEPMNGDEVDRMANGNAECEVLASEEVTIGYTLVVQIMGNLMG